MQRRTTNGRPYGGVGVHGPSRTPVPTRLMLFFRMYVQNRKGGSGIDRKGRIISPHPSAYGWVWGVQRTYGPTNCPQSMEGESCSTLMRCNIKISGYSIKYPLTNNSNIYFAVLLKHQTQRKRNHQPKRHRF